MIRRIVDSIFGVDRYFFWKTRQKSKLARLRCILLGGHKHEWTKSYGGGYGHDVLICKRCHCHVKEYRATQLPYARRAPTSFLKGAPTRSPLMFASETDETWTNVPETEHPPTAGAKHD